MPRFKTDLHIHTSLDFKKSCNRSYGILSPYELVDRAKTLGYKVLSFTHHGALYIDSDISRYARKHGILIIPGLEAFIDDKHVLMYNFFNKEPIDSFSKLLDHKSESNLVVAPHPFYPSKSCLQKSLVENIDCFDALEYCHFYTPFYNPNKKMLKTSDIYHKPVVGFSDTHIDAQFGTTYSLVDAEELSTEAVITAIKQGMVEVVTNPLSLKQFVYISYWLFAKIPFFEIVHKQTDISLKKFYFIGK
ncbi:PHP domain-containing protein [bacterium]|nr:PHP domain-containing protein [bacterium]